MSAYRRWLPIVLLCLAALGLGLYPAAHASIRAVKNGDQAAAEMRYSAALDAYAEAAARCTGCALPRLRQAEIYLVQQRYEEALDVTLDAIRVGGLDDPGASMLARLYLARSSPEHAVGLLRDQLARRPGRGEAWRLLGEAYGALGET